MQTVYLNGGIAKFGKKWEVSCRTIPEIFKLIDCQTPGFRQYLIEAAENGVDFQIQRGEEFVDEDTLLLSLSKEDIIITEVPAGAKSGGAKILTAMAIAALLIINPAGIFTATTLMPGGAGFGVSNVAVATGLNMGGLALATVATSLAIAGMTQLLAPGPEVDSAETNESYLFNGPANTTKQGLPVPVAYGELIVGGATISASFSSTKFPFNPLSIESPNTSTSGGAPPAERNSPNTQGGGADNPCFTSDALVTMESGEQKRIQEVVPGDRIKGRTGVNIVLQNSVHLTPARLYSFNSQEHFITDNHPILTADGWKSFNPEITNETHLGLTKLSIGDVLIKEEGEELLESFSTIYKNTLVYNLTVSGDSTYIVNNFIVHN